MSIIRRDAFRELEDMSNRLDQLFGVGASLLSGSQEALTVTDWSPVVDIAETPEGYLIKAELPEVKKEDVKVNLDNGVLRLEGERRQEREEKGKRFHRVERSYGHFMRTFTLPSNVDEKNVRAEYKDGVLNVQLMKTDKGHAKSIEVKIN